MYGRVGEGCEVDIEDLMALVKEVGYAMAASYVDDQQMLSREMETEEQYSNIANMYYKDIMRRLCTFPSRITKSGRSKKGIEKKKSDKPFPEPPVKTMRFLAADVVILCFLN